MDKLKNLGLREVAHQLGARSLGVGLGAISNDRSHNQQEDLKTRLTQLPTARKFLRVRFVPYPIYPVDKNDIISVLQYYKLFLFMPMTLPLIISHNNFEELEIHNYITAKQYSQENYLDTKEQRQDATTVFRSRKD